MEKQGTDSEGKSSTRRKGQATRGEGEQGGGGGALHGGGRGRRTAAAAGAEQGNRRAQRKEMRGENGQGLICKIKKIQGPLYKVKFPADLELK
jgi:hypothetical protein